MLVLITYDVNTENNSGRRRLAKVANECVMDYSKCREVEDILEKIIDKNLDSLRFYYLGSNYKSKVKHIGIKPSYDIEGTLIL